MISVVIGAHPVVARREGFTTQQGFIFDTWNARNIVNSECGENRGIIVLATQKTVLPHWCSAADFFFYRTANSRQDVELHYTNRPHITKMVVLRWYEEQRHKNCDT